MLNKNHSPCFDSIVQKELMFYAGHFHNQEKDGLPKTALDIKKNKIAVFTSKERRAKEIDRFIFAIGRIEEVELVKDEFGDFNQYICNKDSAIIFKRDRPKFWRYYTNKNAPTRSAWNSLLFKYLEESLVKEILSDIVFTCRFPKNYRIKAENFLQFI